MRVAKLARVGAHVDSAFVITKVLRAIHILMLRLESHMALKMSGKFL